MAQFGQISHTPPGEFHIVYVGIMLADPVKNQTSPKPDQPGVRPIQTRPDQTRPDQAQPKADQPTSDQTTKPNQTNLTFAKNNILASGAPLRMLIHAVLSDWPGLVWSGLVWSGLVG